MGLAWGDSPPIFDLFLRCFGIRLVRPPQGGNREGSDCKLFAVRFTGPRRIPNPPRALLLQTLIRHGDVANILSTAAKQGGSR